MLLQLIGLDITGGYGTEGNGGGLRISGGAVRLQNCNIYGNLAQASPFDAPSESDEATNAGGGGGLAIEGDAEVNLTMCGIYKNNVLSGSGAGVLIRSGTVRFNRCRVFRNGIPPTSIAASSVFRSGFPDRANHTPSYRALK